MSRRPSDPPTMLTLTIVSVAATALFIVFVWWLAT